MKAPRRMPVPPALLEPEAIAAFPDEWRRAVYEVISLRRDVRHFRAEAEIDAAALERILGAAHLAPSVGLSQPWGFVLVRDRGARARIRASFLACREAESIRFPPGRRDAYLAHKLEGILEAPLNVCVVVDLRDRDEAILGTTAQPEAVRASACCAVENLWLAARAEGIGVGWVSIVEPAVLRAELSLPPGVEPVAYLCVGHPVAFRARPMLEETGWSSRRALADVTHRSGRWEERGATPVHAPKPVLPLETQSAPPLDAAAGSAARAYFAQLTKPIGSLGRLEELALWYASARGVFPPTRLDRATLALFAADHGVVVEGVSAYGSQVTAAMVCNVMAGGAAINALAQQAAVDIVLTDIGVAGDLSAAPTSPRVALRRQKVRYGTANMRRGPAMLRVEAEAAMAAGARVASEASAGGAAAIALGEIGIGNTTAAAALTCAVTRESPARVVGPGSGVGEGVLLRKIATVEDALALHRPEPADPIGMLAAIGGLEIAALAGCALEAARLRMPVVLDGFVTNAAALIAALLDPGATAYFVAAHASPEPGAAVALRHMGLAPLLDLQMRLGEGTAAAIAVTLLRTAVHTHLSMATFATAGCVGRSGLEPA
ncbi:MAG: nicotinate-nucleotide--dimethylbenzimidazole phosphoribosyltransferase [Myxococcota bacterium]|nr:nicotinate-nucleotide--dimethylbenzimidazole phosphoribosyltransferase [Myxococcota bacterium]